MTRCWRVSWYVLEHTQGLLQGRVPPHQGIIPRRAGGVNAPLDPILPPVTRMALMPSQKKRLEKKLMLSPASEEVRNMVFWDVLEDFLVGRKAGEEGGGGGRGLPVEWDRSPLHLQPLCTSAPLPGLLRNSLPCASHRERDLA